MERIFCMTARQGLKSRFWSGSICFLAMTASETITLTACASVVPSAAPAGPSRIAPMKR